MKWTAVVTQVHTPFGKGKGSQWARLKVVLMVVIHEEWPNGKGSTRKCLVSDYRENKHRRWCFNTK